ncbi:exopolysaccharide biosynthesis polyprenyl glycosylphosphotransferase [Sphingobium algorifonticola]|uniref:Exopolysaccharide biosynthesis polyprenyl glycosylphosphotransferase n=1 Tax=Sphingobium algorifonticola TaxID=2008318 RepID=A0A437J747_9SPHN|nr:exopolysaccharide biosynthesis polyprenyl glycosylphosphotransferase [Sphingobium algorifonticola]RVT41013.1 exopolysaccharide biosynthesis polyprenyl glycosylphosphotransferase [Sphingobium algorifonticola]
MRAGPSLSGLRVRLYLGGVMADVLMLGIAFALANLLVIGRIVGEPAKPHGLVMFAMIAPVYALLAVQAGVYGIRGITAVRSSALRACWAFAQAVLLMLVIVYFGKIAEQLSRLTFAVGVSLSLIGLAALRPGMAWLVRRLAGALPTMVVLIVDGVAFAPRDDAMRIDAVALGIDPTRHDAEMAARLAAAVGHAERVVVACPNARIADWSVALKSLEARGEILVPELARFAPAKLDEYARHPTLVVAGGPLQYRDRIVKRLFDLVVALLATVLLSPILIAVALAVKLDSPGPVFFRQQRMGRDARLFGIFKFRTMRNDMADDRASQLTRRDDPRVTRIGAFLRRTSIDELPQIFNVLKGDMSIVGPRPHAPAARAADKLYWEVDDRYWERHCIKPGITGLAQVRGHRGATNVQQDLIDRLQSDLEYVTNWSIWRDVRIMLATLRVLVHDRAY